MSKRELHLCDLVERNNVPCDEKYYKTCPVCDTELCTTHYGTNPIILQVVIAEPRKTLADHSVQVCKRCRDQLLKNSDGGRALYALLAPANDKFVEALRAMLASAALAAEASK